MILDILNTYLQFVIIFSYKFLDVVDNMVHTLLPATKEYVAGGSDDTYYQEGEPCDDLNDMKRIKLLLDIRVAPGSSGVKVSARKITGVPLATSLLNILFWLPAFCVLKASSISRHVLNFIEARLGYDQCDRLEMQLCDGSSRRIISPRKRIKRTTKNMFYNLLPNYFPFSLLLQKNYKVYELPLLEIPESDGILNNSRTKTVEKRKRSDSENENLSDASSSISSSTKATQNSSTCGSSPNKNEDRLSENDKVRLTSLKESADNQLTNEMLEADDDYKSADDPDYSPGEDEGSSSSTNSTSTNSDDDVSHDYEDESIDNLEGNGSNELGVNGSNAATSTTPDSDDYEINRSVQNHVPWDNSMEINSPSDLECSFGSTKVSVSFDSPHSTTSDPDEYEDNN